MEDLYIEEITFKQMVACGFSILIIAGTIFYATKDRKNAEKETVDTTTFRTQLQPKMNELTTNYSDN